MLRDPRELPYLIVAVLVVVTVHEYAHALTAFLLGDPTARDRGRLTLNPISHLDLLGSLLLLIAGFGWAKPVPVEPSNFANPRRGMLAVALAGPLANFAMAFLLGLPFKLGVLGLLVRPAVGVAIPGGVVLQKLLVITILYNVGLGVFNLIPIPPLDGSRVLEAFLPGRYAYQYARIQPWSMLILLVLLFTNVINRPLFAVTYYLFSQAAGTPALLLLLAF